MKKIHICENVVVVCLCDNASRNGRKYEYEKKLKSKICERGSLRRWTSKEIQ